MTSIPCGRSAPAIAGLALLALLTGCAGQRTAPPAGSQPAILHLTGYAGSATGTDPVAGSADLTGGTAPADPVARPGSGYRVTGVLPTGPSAAPVFRFPGRVPIDAVRTLAAALALTGTPVRHAYGWAVTGPGEAQLLVRDDGAGQWSYLRESAWPWCLPQVDLDTPPGAGYATACAAGPVPPSGSASVPPAGPSVAVARAAAGPVLAAVRLTGAEVQVQVGAPLDRVWADPVVAGLPTVGLSTTIEVDRSGVLGADGWLGTPVQGADYPLITAAQALHLLSRMAHPMGVDTSVAAAPALAIACPVPDGPVTPMCGGPTVISGARLGLALRYDGGAPVLVPAWLFSVAGQPTYPIVVTAVAPRYLGEPVTPGGSGAGTGSSSGPPTSVEPAPPGSVPGQQVGAGHGVGPG